MKAITFSINKKLFENMSFVFGLLVAKIVFSSTSKCGSYIPAKGDEEYDIIKDFFTGNF